MQCRRRLLHALTPAVLVLLVSVAPATHARADARRGGADTTTIRDIESSLGGLSAGIAERVHVPAIGPAHGTAVTGFATAASLSWIALLLAAVIALGCTVRSRRDRAPPLTFHLLPA